jgi:hypothetical protein
MWSLLVAAGVPSAVLGFLIWLLKRYIDKRDKEKEKKDLEKELRDQKIEQLLQMMMQISRANNVLATATAKAVQRIPDAKCNGDMTKALQDAADIQASEKEFLINEGIKHIFE